MVALGLGLFAFSMLVAVAIAWKAAVTSRDWNEAGHINLVQVMAQNGKGNGKNGTNGKK
jgi:hypothetical protein